MDEVGRTRFIKAKLEEVLSIPRSVAKLRLKL